VNFKQGTLYLILAWVCVLLTSYALHIWLAHTFRPADYGDYGLVMSVLVWIELVVINGIPYAIQKFVSSDNSRAFGILRTGFKVQLIVSVVLFALAFATAPLITKLFRDDKLLFYLRVAFFDILLYGFFHLLMAYQNGLGNFGKQAFLFIIYSVSKLGFVLLLVSLTHSLVGAFIANGAGSLIGLAFGYFFLGKLKKQVPYEARVLIRFAVPALFYSLMLNLFFYVDLWTVKYFLAAQVSGYYVAASMVARVPYFLFLGLSIAILPTVSSALASGKMEEVRSTIQQAVRFLLLLTVPICVLVSIFSRDIMFLLFPADYTFGSKILAVLIWGMTLLTFFSLLTTIINADNKPRLSFKISVLAIATDVILNRILVPRFEAIGGAIGTTLAVGGGAVVAMIFIYQRFHVFVGFRSLLRIGIGAIGVGFVSRLLTVHGFHFLLAFVLGLLFYGLILFIMGEVKMEEILGLFKSGGKEETVFSAQRDSFLCNR